MVPVGRLINPPRHRHFSDPNGPYEFETRVETLPVFYVDRGTPVGDWESLLARLNRALINFLPHEIHWGAVSDASTPHRVVPATRVLAKWIKDRRRRRLAAPDVPHHINPLQAAGYTSWIAEEVYPDAVNAFWCDSKTNAIAIGNATAGVNESYVGSVIRYITELFQQVACPDHARRLASTARLIANIATARCHFSSASLPASIVSFRRGPTTSPGVSGLESRKS